MSENSVTAKNVLEDYNPVHQFITAYTKEIGVEFPLDTDDYLTLIQGAIGMVPVVGSLVSSVFSVIWGKFFPSEEKYVTKEAFEKRISKLYQDMEKKINAKIDQYASDWCNKKYEALLVGGRLFKNVIDVYVVTKQQGKFVGKEKVKVSQLVIAQHSVFTNSLNEALVFFSNSKYVKFTIKLYLQTAALYLAFLKDTVIYGKDWGLADVYLNGGLGLKSFKDKIHDATAHIFDTYKIFLTQLNKAGNVSIPDWSLLISAYAHGDFLMYPHTVNWLKRHSYKQGLTSFLLPSDIIQQHIFSIDATQVGFMAEGITEVYSGNNKINGQICDYVTGTRDFQLIKGEQRKNTLIYFTLYETVKRTLSFRFFLSNIQNNYNDFKLIVRELDPSNVDQVNKPGYHPDDSLKIKLKEHTQKMKNTKPYPSPYGDNNLECYTSDPITLESSKIYYVEFFSSTNVNLGSYYHRIDIFAGASTEKLGYEEGDRPMYNIDDQNPNDSFIKLAALAAEYDALETAFAVRHPLDKIKGIFGH